MLQFIARCALLLGLAYGQDAVGPTGIITALATHSQTYSENVRLAYLEPVNCTLDFSEDVLSFSEFMITRDATTRILNFKEVRKSKYTFQVDSLVNANVTISVGRRIVQNANNEYNNFTIANFNFEYFAHSPRPSLSIDGFDSTSTNREDNVVYLEFNSTAEYDEATPYFNETFLTFDPPLEIGDLVRVTESAYRMRLSIPRQERNNTDPPLEIACVAAGDEMPEDEDDGEVQEPLRRFPCDRCERPLLCQMRTTYPPLSINNMEFPFRLTVAPIPRLHTEEVVLDMMYDTLSALVSMSAPAYAREPFLVNITWSEPLRDVAAVLPRFDASSPPIDMELLMRNLTVHSPSCFTILVAPLRTGIVTIQINGTEVSMDLAENPNNYNVNPGARTGSSLTVVYSAGPPVAGSLEFNYERPRLPEEYPPLPTQYYPPASLGVLWSGFETATHYDIWSSWGQNISTPVEHNLTATSFTYSDFPVNFGLEYHVYVRAWNYWGEETTVSKIFLHPEIRLIADGVYSIIHMPDLMSPLQTGVGFHVLIPQGGFLSMNPLKVLAFRSVDLENGDRDPCLDNSRHTECTFLNFHLEVPSTQFVVFQRPIRLQFTFGRDGWTDQDFRPRLYYWETQREVWREASSTCAPELVNDRWNALHRIYEVSVCHLSQFAVFASYDPPVSTQVAIAPPRPDSYEDPAFFAILGGAVLVGVLLCCVCYWACIHPAQAAKEGPQYADMGIRSAADRFPRRNFAGEGNLARTRPTEDVRLLPRALGDRPAAFSGGPASQPQPSQPSQVLALEDSSLPAPQRPAGAGVGDLDEDCAGPSSAEETDGDIRSPVLGVPESELHAPGGIVLEDDGA